MGFPWTQEEKDKATELYKDHTAHEIAAIIDRTVGGVVKFLHKNSIGKPRDYYGWSPEKRAFLKENAGKMTVKELSDALGNSYSSIAVQISKLELKKGSRKAVTAEDEEKILELAQAKDRYGYRKYRLKDIVKLTGRNQSTVAMVIRRAEPDIEVQMSKFHWSSKEIDCLDSIVRSTPKKGDRLDIKKISYRYNKANKHNKRSYKAIWFRVNRID